MVASVQVHGLTGDPLATRFFELLIRLVKGSQHQAMAITAEYDLTLTQLRLLYVLDHAPEPLPVSALGETVGLSVAATGRAIDALHRGGLVSRNEDPADRRVKRIALSDAGTDALERITRARFAAVSDFVDALDENERAALAGAVATLDELAARHLAPTLAAYTAAANPLSDSPSQETPA
jgi:DNA-binding MarR family transcriptional regulator